MHRIQSSRSPGRGIYNYSCPNCNRYNTEDRLKRGLPCPLCLSEEKARKITKQPSVLEIADLLREEGTLSGYKGLADLEEEAERLIEFFEKTVGSKPWGAQRTWARRLARRDSFSIVAPTGVGKTTFGLTASLYYACIHKEKSYVMLPTTTLVIQALKRLEQLSEKAGCSARIVSVYSRMRKKAREEAMDRIASGDFDVIVTTAAFARKHVDLVSRYRYRFVFVDDVDAVLKSAKSVDTVLKIVGFREEDIEKGLEYLKLQRQRAALLARLARLTMGETWERTEAQQKREEEVRILLNKVEARLNRLEKDITKTREKVASLIVSTATGRPRGQRVRLFRSLLGFEAGGRSDLGLRRVYDTYTILASEEKAKIYHKVIELVKTLGDGGLVYVPLDHGVEGAEELAALLKETGIIAEAFHSKKPTRLLDEYAEGKIQVLVGVANYYGVLVRGLDLPARVRYAVFAGVPRHKFSADIGEPHPGRLLRLLSLLVEVPMEDIASQARAYMVKLRDLMRRLSPAALHVIAERVMEGQVEEYGSATRLVAEAFNFLRQALADDEVWRHLEHRRDVAVTIDNGKRYVLIADAPTYIQASGRTSRLYAGGITRGLSVVVVDYETVFNGLVKRTSWYTESKWARFEDLDLERVLREIDEDRERVKRVIAGKETLGDLVKTALLVVESPNKARTIAGFFGQPSIRLLPGGLRVYEVAVGDYILSITASGGHVYDLEPFVLDDLSPLGIGKGLDIFGVVVRENGEEFTPVYTSIKRCLECGHQFTADIDRCPVCGSKRIRDSRIVVDDIRRVAWEVDMVLIGTDPDVEGEKIGWDVSMLIKPYSRAIRRLEFHEVTKKAILEALKSTREFNQNLVDAQIVRRVEDRWIGFTLSPLLWCHFWPYYYCPRLADKKALGRFIKLEKNRCRRQRYYYNLSAGRVQTPVLGWIVSRTREAKEKVLAVRISVDGFSFMVREDSTQETRGEEVKGDLKDLVRRLAKNKKRKVRITGESTALVRILEEKWEQLPPPPPYTTDTMLADASRLLRMGAPETMRLAQNLFEWGFITYHRTDSTRVSEKGMQVARDWLREKFGEELGAKLYRPRRWGEGGAHEAIRPTRPLDAETLQNLIAEGVIETPGAFTRAHLMLYDMIFRRFMASQMREAEVRRIRYEFSLPAEGPVVVVGVEGIVDTGKPGDPASKGWTIVWDVFRKLPLLAEGIVKVGIEVFPISKVPLYTQGEIIQEMKNRGIGRPSTYAKIVETLLKRKYIMRINSGRRGDQVFATIRGEMVYEYLTSYFTRANKSEVLHTLPSLSEDIEQLLHIPGLVSEERTRQLENKMSLIEEGEINRLEVMREIYEEIGGLARKLALIPKLIVEGHTGNTGIYQCLRRASIVTASLMSRKVKGANNNE